MISDKSRYIDQYIDQSKYISQYCSGSSKGSPCHSLWRWITPMLATGFYHHCHHHHHHCHHNHHKNEKVAPYGGAKGLLPTNPWAVAIPGDSSGPVVIIINPIIFSIVIMANITTSIVNYNWEDENLDNIDLSRFLTLQRQQWQEAG